ncbi:MAG: thioredoxin family protein [Proteobacteria bacterium]|nr:MAG: thioredoxin family protein [Pseudomonadota bacterium]
MARTESIMLELGTPAPAFTLPNTNPDYGGEVVSVEDCAEAPALLVAFICNHCPFVVHIKEDFSRFASEFAKKGLAVIAVSANDAAEYPQDGPDAMAEDAARFGFTFPYLYDEDQHVAKAYSAACTPDFYLFDRDRRLVYRGQYDSSRPGNGVPVTGVDLRAAADAVLAGEAIDAEQKPSIGCNIKWKSGNAPAYSG